jgi:UDP-N-acetylmuramoyl-tripeptide--D-alanyl-D-alanine ligase
MTVAQMVQAVAGRLHDAALLGDVCVHGLFTDTRKPIAGAVFVALRGANFDAHDFAATAVAGGAAVLVVDHALHDIDVPQVVVVDTRLALGLLAAAWCAEWRKQGGKLVALTGSNGKTTTKEMLAGILREACAFTGVGGVLATRGNLNNDIGVPLMLAELDAAQRFAVIEMGANHAGEIAYLTALARPDVALVTNTGRAHLEGFGGEQGVILAKGEIFGGLTTGGIAVINLDDKGAETWLAFNAGHSLTFSMQQAAEMRGRWQADEGRLDIAARGTEFALYLRVAGAHNAHNALAAAAAAWALGIGPTAIQSGLEKFTGVAGRLQRKSGLHGGVLWDDTYNANPDSLQAGICAMRAVEGETWLILGDMGELGADRVALHAEAGRMACALGVARLFTLGELAQTAADSFGADAQAFLNLDDLLAAVRADVHPQVQILVKGSRSARMERVVQALTQAQPMEGAAC